MKANSPNSRKSTIMFTDIVGYSKMVEKKEKKALQLLEEHNQILTLIIEKNNGKIIKHIGDSIFAEFNSVLNCTSSAIKIQSDLRKRNDISRKNQKIIIRIGIHTGTVYEREDDLFGNDVNLCSRIEGIAPRGGIAASSDLIEKLTKSDKIYSREIGYVNLKNIRKPKLLYKIYYDNNEFKNETQVDLQKNQIENGTDIVDIEDFQSAEIFSVGILILKNITDDKDDNIGEIITERLISHFQKIKEINMPNINDSQHFKDSDLPLSEIARRLEINNLIYGNISKTKNQLIINLNMLDTTKGDVVWSEKYKENENNLGILCGKIIDSLLVHFDVDVPDKIKKLISTSISSKPKALKNYYKGMSYIENTKTTEDLKNAKSNFNNAIKEDHNFVEAIAQLSITSEKLGYHHEADKYIQEAIQLAEELGNESSLAVVYNCAGILYKTWNKYNKAIPFFKKAIKIQIHLEDQFTEAKTLSSLAGCYNNTKDPETALRLLSKSISIKEEIGEGRSLAYSYAELGNTNVTTGDLSASILHFQKSLGKFTYYEMDFFIFRILILLAQIHLDIGDDLEAERYLEKARPICDELNESLMMGLYFGCQAKLSENKNSNVIAIENYNKSIDYFQECDFYDKLFSSLISLGSLQVRNGLYKEAEWNYSKADAVLKRISDPLTELTINTNKLYLSSLLGNCSLEDCNHITNELKSYLGTEFYYSEWWLIAKTYYQLDSIQEAINCQKKAQDLLKKCSSLISNKEHRKTFLYSDVIRKEIWLDLSKIQKANISNKISNIYNFCPNCGKSNENHKNFCSGCGKSLSK